MKQSKMTNLRVGAAGTKKLRAAMQQARSIKITITPTRTKAGRKINP